MVDKFFNCVAFLREKIEIFECVFGNIYKVLFKCSSGQYMIVVNNSISQSQIQISE